MPRMSLSLIAIDVPVTLNPCAAPAMFTSSSFSSMASSTGVSVKLAVPEVWPAAIVSVKSATAAKSSVEAVPPDTDTVTAVSDVPGAPFRAPVTVIAVAPASSSTASSDTVSVTPVDAVSSSATVTATSAAVTEP